jgi:hypothetical protein
MPFASQAQRRYMYLKHPEIAKRWEKETPAKPKLPQHVEAADAEGSESGDGGASMGGSESVDLANKFKQTDETVSDDNSRMESLGIQSHDDIYKQFGYRPHALGLPGHWTGPAGHTISRSPMTGKTSISKNNKELYSEVPIHNLVSTLRKVHPSQRLGIKESSDSRMEAYLKQIADDIANR